MSTTDESKFDVRHVERFIAEGKLTRAEYDAWLAQLPDSGDQAEASSVRFTVSDPTRRPGDGPDGPADEG